MVVRTLFERVFLASDCHLMARLLLTLYMSITIIPIEFR
jgi:hypothetical protein